MKPLPIFDNPNWIPSNKLKDKVVIIPGFPGAFDVQRQRQTELSHGAYGGAGAPAFRCAAAYGYRLLSTRPSCSADRFHDRQAEKRSPGSDLLRRSGCGDRHPRADPGKGELPRSGAGGDGRTAPVRRPPEGDAGG